MCGLAPLVNVTLALSKPGGYHSCVGATIGRPTEWEPNMNAERGRMMDIERDQWFRGKRHREISTAVVRGAYGCDTCGEPSAAISHSGEGSRVVVACPKCYRAALDAERANRPSRAALIARVNAAIGRA